jgi:hypothetical protein
MFVLHSRRMDELELGGTSFEYGELARLVLAGKGCLPLAAVADPSPYDNALVEITVVRRPAQAATITFVRETRTLEISGDEASLTVLAENLSEFGAESTPDEHLHIEYFPGHFYLGSTSHPLVAVLSSENRRV